MLLSLNTQTLTHTCINPWYLRATLVVWNWPINLTNFALRPNTSALNGIVFMMLSKTAVLWFRRLTWPFNWLISSQNLCHAHGLSNYDNFSWVGDTFLIKNASFSLHLHFFFFCLMVLFCTLSLSTPFMVAVHKGAITLVVLSQWFTETICTFVLVHLQWFKLTSQEWGSVVL